MTLKEEEITRKEMAKILPSIQIGHIDKDVKQYLNSTIDDIIEEEAKETKLKDNIDENQDEKNDTEAENKVKSDVESIPTEIKAGLEQITNIKEVPEAIIEADIPSSAGSDVNNFLNNLLLQVDRVNKKEDL